MKRIISVVKPFDIIQNVFIYEDKNILETFEVNFENITDELLKLAKEKSILDIELIGPKKFSKKIKENILEKENLNYNENKINIKLSYHR